MDFDKIITERKENIKKSRDDYDSAYKAYKEAADKCKNNPTEENIKQLDEARKALDEVEKILRADYGRTEEEARAIQRAIVAKYTKNMSDFTRNAFIYGRDGGWSFPTPEDICKRCRMSEKDTQAYLELQKSIEQIEGMKKPRAGIELTLAIIESFNNAKTKDNTKT